MSKFPIVADGSGLTQHDTFFKEELQLALRNRGLPLEALRYQLTPTGMHYLLIHYDIPAVNETQWRLTIGGLVSKSLSLSLRDLKNRPSRTIAVTLECAGNGRARFIPRRVSQPWISEAIGTAEWKGVPLVDILKEAGLRDEVVEIVFTGLDRGVEGGEEQYYQRSLTRNEATREEVLLAYEMNGEPLPPQHGFPLRLVVPGWYGMTNVKWLDRIEAVAAPFKGYQMRQAYRYQETADDQGEPVTLMRVRALMIPPGIPDFLTRARVARVGSVTLTGKAWAGRAGIRRVEVSVDGGTSWSDAILDDQPSPFVWRGWTFVWQARPGTHTLCVRATDATGSVQPMQQRWNAGGYGNNAVQRMDVVVE
jgi:DMSO/TMAO reductase YedYZ molybdopterin-dependent catalytic subunit